MCFLFFVCFLSPLVWFFLWLPEEVLTLLFLLHRENGDFSVLMKDILSLLCFTQRKSKHPSHESAFQSTRKQYFHCLYVIEAGIKAIHECVFAVYKKAVLLLLVSFTGRYQKHPGQCVLQSTRKQYVLHDWL